MDITLKPEYEQLIQAQIQTGRFPDANAVLEAALQLLISEDAQAYFAWVEETRQQVAVGIAELDRGDGIDRLVMLLTDSLSIRDVIAFPLLKPEKTDTEE